MLPIRQVVARAAAVAPSSIRAQTAACRIAQAVETRRAFSQTRTQLFSPSSRSAEDWQPPQDYYQGERGEQQQQQQHGGQQQQQQYGGPPQQQYNGGGDRNNKMAYSSIDKKRSVFVGNVAMELGPEEIREIFNEYAPVTEVVKGVGGAHWFVYFTTEQEATNVVEAANGLFVRGRQMRVQPRLAPMTPRQFNPGAPGRGALRNPSATLFIGNMPYNMTDQDLNDLSKQLEYCFDIRVAIDRHTGWPRGYAHADFYTVGLAQRALRNLVASNAKMGPNPLRFDFASTSTGSNTAFTIARLRALKTSGKTLDDYEELTEKLKREEGDWSIPNMS